MNQSRKDLQYHDKVTNEKYVPYVIEPALGLDRLLLTVLCDAYRLESLENGEERVVLGFHPSVAPMKAAVLPLSKDDRLQEVAQNLHKDLLKNWPVEYDETQSIGKRYRRQDEIGTPFCITIDFDTLGESGEEKKDTVTIRERDSMTQVRIPLSEVKSFLASKLVV